MIFWPMQTQANDADFCRLDRGRGVGGPEGRGDI
jgi:hypothetical protein